MPGIDHTTYILYRYLKELSVKISYGRGCLKMRRPFFVFAKKSGKS